MNHKVFIKCLENAFGEYRPGMRVLVEDWAASFPGDYLDRLMQEISRTHDAGYPPTLAKLIKESTSMMERTRYPALSEPPVTDAERAQVKAWLAGLLADLAKAKAGKVKS